MLVAFPIWAGDDVLLRSGTGGALPWHLKDRGPAVEHREEVVAVIGFRKTQNVGLLAHIEPGGAVERVGIGRGDILEGRSGILAQDGLLPHRCPCAFRLGDIGRNPPRHFHGDQRIAVDIGIYGNLLGILWRD